MCQNFDTLYIVQTLDKRSVARENVRKSLDTITFPELENTQHHIEGCRVRKRKRRRPEAAPFQVYGATDLL